MLQDGVLLLDPFGERSGADAPLGIGIAPPSAGTGAWRIDHDEIAAAAKVSETVTADAASGRGPHLNVARAGARKPRMDRRQPALVEIGGINLAAIVHRRCERQGFTSSAGAQIDDLLARFGVRQQRRELRAFVLDFDLALE